MGNCDFRTAPQTNDKEATFDNTQIENARSGAHYNNDTTQQGQDNYQVKYEEENYHKVDSFGNNHEDQDPSVPAHQQTDAYANKEQSRNIDVDDVVYENHNSNNENIDFRGDGNSLQENKNNEDSFDMVDVVPENHISQKKKVEAFKVEHPLKKNVEQFKDGIKNIIKQEISNQQ